MFTSAPKKDQANGRGNAYERHRQRAAGRQATQAAAGRDIGPIPAIENPQRRGRARHDFLYFCKAYLPDLFRLPWSDDHKTVGEIIRRCVTEGGLFAEAMPRGSGKTCLAEAAALWSMLYRHRRFVVLIGSAETSAQERLESIKIELETNPRLLADFPEAAYPIQRLERIANRCKGQLCDGKPTYITWTQNTLRLPTTPGNPPGAILTTCGITGRIRGLNFKTPTGSVIRPDLVVIDDPQTDESARSVSQTEYRERIIGGAVLGLAGPDQRIAAIMPCTVVQDGDLADRMLDHKTHPEWQGQRLQMVYQWPTGEAATQHWEHYAKSIREDQANGLGRERATRYYRQHRKAMDAGAKVAWPACKHPDELSAIQHAYNLWIIDPRAFAAEYQNAPLPPYDDTEIPQLEPDQLASRVNGYQQREVPPETHKLNAFIDVQKRVLFYTVIAWRQDFTGYVVDYGTWPQQRQSHFTYRQIQHTLARKYPGQQLEGQLFNGISDLAAYLFGDHWSGHKVDLALIDANWGESTDVVYSTCRQLPYRLYPSHGKAVGATSKPITEYRGKAKNGLNWRIPAPSEKRGVRHVLYDTNYWKSHVAARLLTATGDAGSLTFHKGRDHRMFAQQLASEYRLRVEARGRTVWEWKERPDKPDNHFWDCVVGAAVAASIEGCTLPALTGDKPGVGRRRKKKKVSYLS